MNIRNSGMMNVSFFNTDKNNIILSVVDIVYPSFEKWDKMVKRGQVTGELTDVIEAKRQSLDRDFAVIGNIIKGEVYERNE